MNASGVEGPHSSTTAPGGKPEVEGLSVVPFYLSALKNNPDSEKVEYSIHYVL